MMLTKQQQKNFKNAIAEVTEIIWVEKKELAKAEECLAYMHLNILDDRIEKNIIDVLTSYVDDTKKTISSHESEKKSYEEHLQKGG